MAFPARLSVSIAISGAAAILASYAMWATHSRRQRQIIRQKLPGDLHTWRLPGHSHEDEEEIWRIIGPVFRNAGFTLWPWIWGCILKTPGTTPGAAYPSPTGFGYATPYRPNPDSTQSPIGTAERLRIFYYSNPLSRPTRTPERHDLVIRVVVIGNEGHDHLKIIRRLGTGKHSLYSNNHALPMFSEFQFEDIIFGLFPRVGSTMEESIDGWAKNSVGDIVDMIMQMLEALAFIHELNIAHRDAFYDNFLVQWQPESLLTMKISPSRPRVYLIDFEVAVAFPLECAAEERVSTGYPFSGSMSDPERYARPLAPEITSGKPYNPFKLDVWQLGISLSNFKSTIPAIDDVLVIMAAADPIQRIDAQEALDRIAKVVHSMSPESLLIPP
ncbi:kinase-like domain-containing protein [Lyophyllum atratum]|nr:kinase-like domain-containing protein [Lyophyllum atratum]